jgi:hypothetical protein
MTSQEELTKQYNELKETIENLKNEISTLKSEMSSIKEKQNYNSGSYYNSYSQPSYETPKVHYPVYTQTYKSMDGSETTQSYISVPTGRFTTGICGEDVEIFETKVIGTKYND